MCYLTRYLTRGAFSAAVAWGCGVCPRGRVILDKLIRYRPSASKFPIIVSQDCMDDNTATIIRSYSDRGVELYQQPNQTDPMPQS